MPSRDSTGKPLSGAAKRRLAAAKAAAAGAPPDELAAARERREARAAAPAPAPEAPGVDPCPLQVPALPDTVEQAVVWAAVVQARAARLAREGQDPDRVRAVSAVVGAMGKLRAYAKDSEDAVIVLGHYLRQPVDVRGPEPPAEPAGLCAWAFWQLAELLAETATAESAVDEGAVSHRARALAQLNHVRPQARLDEIDEQRRKLQEE